VPALIATHDVKFSLYTTPDSLESLKSAAVNALRAAGPAAESLLGQFEIEQLDVDPTDTFDETARQDIARLRRLLARRLQATCLLKEISACLKTDSVMVLCSADCFFGDGSVANVVEAACADRATVAVPYLRVDETQFRELLATERLPIANDRLASLAMLSLHDSARSTVRGGNRHLSYLFGIDIVPLSARLFGINYRTPSVLAARFDKSDLAYFMMSGDFREWDSGWTQKLIAERRFRFLGSTDLAFFVEPTPKTRGSVEMYLEQDDHVRGLIDVRDHCRHGLHNETMRNLIVSVRTDRDVVIQPY
jgi:hypothetical protein